MPEPQQPSKFEFTKEEFFELMRAPKKEEETTRMSFEKILSGLVVTAIVGTVSTLFVFSQDITTSREKLSSVAETVKEIKTGQIQQQQTALQVGAIGQQLTGLTTSVVGIQNAVDKLRSDVTTVGDRANERMTTYERNYITEETYRRLEDRVSRLERETPPSPHQ